MTTPAWDMKPLGSLLRAAPRYGINASAVPVSLRGHPYLRITDIDSDGRYAPSPKVHVDRADAGSYVLRPGQIVFARTGASVGKSYLYRETDGDLVFAGFLICVEPNPAVLNPEYLAAYAQAGTYWNWVAMTSMRSGQPGINAAEYAASPIPLPPITVQNQISEVLSDAATLIWTVESLIAKKEAIEQGLMRELISGNTRRPGFADEWSNAKLVDLVKGLEAGVSVRSDPLLSYGPFVLKTSALSRGRLIEREVKSILAPDIPRARCHLRAGSVLVSRMNTPTLVGEVAYVPRNRRDVFVPDRVWQLRKAADAPVDMRWLTAFLSCGAGAARVRELATGTSGSMKNIPKAAFLSLQIALPPIAEQRAIAQVLSDAADEIDALRARLTKAKAVKQGMMQALLTGRARLPVNGADEPVPQPTPASAVVAGIAV